MPQPDYSALETAIEAAFEDRETVNTETRGEVREAVETADRGDGVLILTDMFGGTPSNLAISVMEPNKVEVIAGANLPMLIKLASVRGEKPLSQAISDAQEAGRKYINVASQVLNGK